MSTRNKLTDKQEELLKSARTNLLGILEPGQGLLPATEFAADVSTLIADIEKLLGY